MVTAAKKDLLPQWNNNDNDSEKDNDNHSKNNNDNDSESNNDKDVKVKDQITSLIQRTPTGKLSMVACLNFT